MVPTNRKVVRELFHAKHDDSAGWRVNCNKWGLREAGWIEFNSKVVEQKTRISTLNPTTGRTLVFLATDTQLKLLGITYNAFGHGAFITLLIGMAETKAIRDAKKRERNP